MNSNLDWKGRINRTSIEMVDAPNRSIPYHQINWKPYTFPKFGILESGETYVGVLRVDNRGKLTVEENRLKYELDVPEPLRLFHAKCWFIFRFEGMCRIKGEGFDNFVDCVADEAPKNIEGLPYGRMWRRVVALEQKPASIIFPNWQINLIKCEPFRAMFLYAKHDRSLLELSFVWCRHSLPKGRYETVLEFGESSWDTPLST